MHRCTLHIQTEVCIKRVEMLLNALQRDEIERKHRSPIYAQSIDLAFSCSPLFAFFCCFDYRFIGPNDWIQMKSWNLSQEYANVRLNTQSIELQRKQQSQAPNIVEYIVSISCSFHWNCSQLNSAIAARDDKSSFSIWTWIIIKAFVCLSFKWVLCNVTFDIHVENKYRPFSLSKNDTVVI